MSCTSTHHRDHLDDLKTVVGVHSFHTFGVIMIYNRNAIW